MTPSYMRGAYQTPPIVKNLLIINCIVFVAEMILPSSASNWLLGNGALYFWAGGHFQPYQLVTYMFLHGGLSHLFFNMFALWMFGRVLEYDMGSKRFFAYYMICGIGAGVIQLGVNWVEYSMLLSSAGSGQTLFYAANASTIGASGAIFGLLLAYGMIHPNNVLMLIFPPIALKAKWFVLIYGALELLAGIAGSMSSVAHYAHLGGMLWGFLLLRYWKKRGDIYY